MKERTLTKAIKKATKTFPAIVLTGARQTGKTTLLKTLFSKTHRFVSLEDPDIRLRAVSDPIQFLHHNKAPVVLDEIQYAPELLSYIKTLIDENRKPGQWLLTGSQQFSLMQGVSQSLAGRAAIVNLAPFSYAEKISNGSSAMGIKQWIKKLQSKNANHISKKSEMIEEVILRGGYPEIATKKNIETQLWFASYIASYIERDVRTLGNIGDLNLFNRFLQLCAIRTGQILNLSDIAKETGISVPTVKKWLSILETGGIVHLLQPYYRNLGKRLVKSPKIYFSDTGLACYLMGIHDLNVLRSHLAFETLFETFAVNDILKRFIHVGQRSSMYYLRTQDGLEVDLVIDLAGKLSLFEFKSGMTITPKHADHLKKLKKDSKIPVENAFIVSNGKENFPLTKEVYHWNWREVFSI